MKKKQIEMAECKTIMLGILKYLDEVCRNNNIEYTLMGGSLIGAIRHKGMIPWDDDIDVMLMRDDYDRLIEILSKEKSKQYSVLTWENNKTYPFPFAKLVDTRTTLIEKNIKTIDNYGLFVDIFPCDSLPKKFGRMYFLRKKFYRRLMGGYMCIDNQNMGIAKKIRKFVAEKIYGRERILRNFDKLSKKYNNSDKASNQVAHPWFSYNYKKAYIKGEFFDSFTDAEFDGLKVRIVEKYDEYLRFVFGDYMVLPPVEKRKSHGLTAYWRD